MILFRNKPKEVFTLCDYLDFVCAVSEHKSRAEQIREVTRDLKDGERLLNRVEHPGQIVCWAKKLKKSLPVIESKEWERFEVNYV